MNEKSVVKVGDVVNAKIVSLGKQGDGIAKENGFVIIVKAKNLVVGEKVFVTVTKVLPKFAIANLESV